MNTQNRALIYPLALLAVSIFALMMLSGGYMDEAVMEFAMWCAL